MNNKKRILSLLLALLMMCTSFSAFSTAAYAANKTKYYDQKVQYNSQSASCNFDSKHYVEYRRDKNKIYVYNSLGGKVKKKISTSNKFVMRLVIKGKYIYFSDYDGGIYRVGIDGKGMKKILNGGYDFIIAKDKIIYGVIDYKSKKVNIYSTNMSGKSKKKIGTTGSWSKFFTCGDNLYFISGKKLCVYNLKKNKKKTYSADKSLASYTLVSMQGKTLYFAKETGFDDAVKSSFYKMDVSKRKVKKIIGTKKMVYGNTALVYKDAVYELSGNCYGNFVKITDKKKKQYGNALYEACSQAFYKDTVIASKVDRNENILGYKKVVKVD